MQNIAKETLIQFYERVGMQEHAYMADSGLETLLARSFTKEEYAKLSGGRYFTDIPVGELLNTFFSSWDKQSILNGMEFLACKLQEDQVFYDLYTGEEKRKDPAVEKTGLAVFTVPGNKPYVMICPGGGYYSVCSLAEGYAIAKVVHELGFNACVLVYRVGPYVHYPNPSEDLARAVRFMTEHAESYGIDPEGYALMGFSAGGHLAASFGTEALGFSNYGVKAPRCMILAYPVITMGAYAHPGSREYLLGKAECDIEEIRDKWSVEKQITSHYPSTFLWQCDGDPAVPIENSRMLAAALKHSGVSSTYEVWPGEAHDWGLGTGTPAQGWLERALAFCYSIPGAG